MNIDRESALNMLEFLKDNSDERYTKDVPYPPSEQYVRFYNALADALGEPHYYSSDEPESRYEEEFSSTSITFCRPENLDE